MISKLSAGILAGLIYGSSAMAACDVTVTAVHPNGQVTLAANCGAVDLDNISWLRDGSVVTGPVDVSAVSPKINNLPVHLTVAVPSGTHVYSATANAGAVTAGARAVVTAAAKDITVSVTAGGSVASSPAGITACTSAGGTCTASFDHGTNVILTATPSTGYTFGGWSGDCSGAAKDCAVNASAVRSVAAAFSPSPVNGTCGGASNSTPVASAPSSNLCSTGSASGVTDPSAAPYNYTWTCSGLNGGTNSGTCSAPKIVNGACGALISFGAQSSTPSNAATMCAVGTPSSVTTTTTVPYEFRWTCGGVNGGTTSAQCAVAQAATNGVCGSASGFNTASAPTGSAACTAGSVTGMNNPAPGGTYTWTCAGLAGGTSSGACSANQTVAAACGAANNVAVASAPTTNLCVAGNVASAVSGTGPFTWTCSGVNPTSGPVNCSAPKLSTGSATDPGIGTGLWIPPGTSGIFVHDQTTGGTYVQNYVPGCLGLLSPSGSFAGCAANSSLTATYGGTPYTISMAQGNIVSIRIMSKPTVNTNKGTKVSGNNGGTVPVPTTFWISTKPPGTTGGNVEDVVAGCKKVGDAGTPTLYTSTLAGYCAIQPNTLYYLNMRADGACSGSLCRYQLTEGADWVNTP